MGGPNRSTAREPRWVVVVVSTLMPHLAAERHHLYRNATALALLAALLAAALGSLSIALVLAAGNHRLPPVSRILELGVLVPMVAFVAVLVAPLLVTGREAFGHPMDVVVTTQGTVQRYGVWVTLLNPSTRISGFIDLYAYSNDALNAALPDAKDMIGSMM